MKVLRSFTIPASLEDAAATLCSESFNLERERMREEVVSTSFHLLEESAELRVFEVRSVEYRRTKLGSIDRSGTCESKTQNRWDGRAHMLSWVYSGGAAPTRMAISGVYRLTPDGRSEATRVEHDVSIEVKVALIGGQISKLAAREFEQTAPRYEQLLVRHAVGRRASAP
jgi:hypothetical protein